MESEIRIYEKNGGLCADYWYKIGTIDNKELKEVSLRGKETPISDFCLNDVWCVEFQNESENMESVNSESDTESVHREITLISDNVLQYQEFVSPNDIDPGYMFYGTYLRKGSEEYLHADEY